MKELPKFSVLMSVYYKEKPEYLKQAIDSILDQTLKPSEFVIIEDGPLTDELNECLEDYSKKNKIIKLVKLDKNQGLGKALNEGLKHCSYEYVARMDSDDISFTNRFEKQMKVFANTDVDVVGSNIVEYDESMKNITSERIVPEYNKDIQKRAKKRNPMNHMTVAYKKDAVVKSGNYQDMQYFEDYYLWARMINNNYNFYNIQESLVKVRGGNDMIKRRGGKTYIKPIIDFEKAIKSINLINEIEYLINIFERIIVSLIPNNLRFIVYKKVLRK